MRTFVTVQVLLRTVFSAGEPDNYEYSFNTKPAFTITASKKSRQYPAAATPALHERPPPAPGTYNRTAADAALPSG